MTTTGTVDITGAHATLRFRRRLAHKPADVWAALTDPAQLKAWFMTDAKIDVAARNVEMVSGPARMHWTGRILTWDPPRVFEYEWKIAPRDVLPEGEDTVVRWELAPDGDGTLLSLTHTNLTKPTALGFAPGTHALLDRLEAQLADDALPAWQARYDAVKDQYPAWSR